jgi:hypothetical protein
MSDDCSRRELPGDVTCKVVNSRLTLYVIGASNSSAIVQAVLTYISGNMTVGSLNVADNAIIKLRYLNQIDDANIDTGSENIFSVESTNSPVGAYFDSLSVI